MFSTSRLNRLALSVSTAALTVVGTFSPLNSAVVNKAACKQGDVVGASVTQAPATERTAADKAAVAYSNPDVRLNAPPAKFERQTSSSGTKTVEFANEIAADNFCNLEVDVLAGTNKTEEIEEQLPSFSQLPPAVFNRLKRELPNYTVTFIEKSTRPGLRPVPPLTPNTVVYEIEGTCNGINQPYCTSGTKGEAQISSDGTKFVFEPAT